MTSVMYLIKYRQNSIFSLIKKSHSKELVDKDGRTVAFYIAIYCTEKKGLLATLKEWNISSNKTDAFGKTVAMYMIENRNIANLYNITATRINLDNKEHLKKIVYLLLLKRPGHKDTERILDSFGISINGNINKRTLNFLNYFTEVKKDKCCITEKECYTRQCKKCKSNISIKDFMIHCCPICGNLTEEI